LHRIIKAGNRERQLVWRVLPFGSTLNNAYLQEAHLSFSEGWGCFCFQRKIAAFEPMKPIFILNGPNLNLIGEREPEIYGVGTLADIEDGLRKQASAAGLEIEFRQSNHEGVLVDWIQEARHAASALILNAGAYTHTSVAVLDALRLLAVPIAEVHLSNIFKRESFRHRSYVSPAATGVICGFGAQSYRLALAAMIEILESSASTRGLHA
jgi:3-dehydroquinate dehydratase II